MNNTSISLDPEKFEELLDCGNIAQIKKILSRGFSVDKILNDLPPLSLALQKGNNYKVVELLISSRADVCQLDASGKWCPMFYAIKSKCPQKIIRRLILAGAPINGVVEYNCKSTALHLAVYANQKSIIKCLLSLSADVNITDKNGMTPLHIAVQANHPKIVKLLATRGAEMDAECFDKFTPLMLAIHDNNSSLVDLLIAFGSDVNYESSKPKYSYQKPLNYAAGLGHREIMNQLLSRGAKAESATSFGDSPLHSVALSVKLIDKSVMRDIIQILIEHGGDLHCYNDIGQNPLHSATITKNTLAVKCLLKAGANVMTVTKTEDTPLHLAAAVGDSTVVKFLLSSGADRTVVNSFGLSPYDLALKQADTDTVRMFWKYGQPYDEMRLQSEQEIHVDIQKLMKEQKNFFHALEFGSFEEFSESLKNGAEPNCRSLLLNSPLHFAVSQNKCDMVRELLDRGVPVGIVDESGETALHIASKSPDVVICLNLLAHGACYNSVSRYGKTPYVLAKDNKQVSVANVLEFTDHLFFFEYDPKILIEDLVTEMADSFLSEQKFVVPTHNDYRHLLLQAFLNCVNVEGHTLLSKALSLGLSSVALQIMRYRLKDVKVD